METRPATISRSTTKPDPLIAALSVVCPLICGRAIDPETILYIRLRVGHVAPDVLLEAITWLGDHADRVGNPIAAILERCAVVAKDRTWKREAAERADHDAKCLSPEESRARLKETLAGLGKAKAVP